MTPWLPWALVAISLIDLLASWILVRAARRPPRVALLYDRARAAIISTLAVEMLALLAQIVIHGIRLPESWLAAMFIAAILLPGLTAPLFLIDYLLGAYNENGEEA